MFHYTKIHIDYTTYCKWVKKGNQSMLLKTSYSTSVEGGCNSINVPTLFHNGTSSPSYRTQWAALWGGRGGKLNNAFSADAAGFRTPHTPLICETYFHFRFSFFVLFSDLMLSFQNCTVMYFDLFKKKFELNTSSNKNVTFSKKEFKNVNNIYWSILLQHFFNRKWEKNA